MSWSRDQPQSHCPRQWIRPTDCIFYLCNLYTTKYDALTPPSHLSFSNTQPFLHRELFLQLSLQEILVLSLYFPFRETITSPVHQQKARKQLPFSVITGPIFLIILSTKQWKREENIYLRKSLISSWASKELNFSKAPRMLCWEFPKSKILLR